MSIYLFIILLFPVLFTILLVFGQVIGSKSNINSTDDFQVPFPDNTSYVVTSHFGYRTDPKYGDTRFHSGLDLAPPDGTEILASATGKVVEVGYSPSGLGYYVYIEHMINDKKYYTGYGHMLENSIIVQEGQIVQAKEKIGIVGSTGKSTGVHLHFMIMKDRISFNEKDLIDPFFITEKDNN